MSYSLVAPHRFIEEVEKLGFYFSRVIPHFGFDRFIFLQGDMTCYIAFNGHGYAVSHHRFQNVLFKHLDFSLTKQQLFSLLQTIHY